MFSLKILSLFMVLHVAAFAKVLVLDPSYKLDLFEERYRRDHYLQKRFIIYTYDHLMDLSGPYAACAFDVCRNILKDEEFMANDKPEVLEFRKKLKMFVEKYQSSKDLRTTWDIVDIYDDAVDCYYMMADENKTPESQFIIDILNKYEAKNIEEKFMNQFNDFNTVFMIKFEEEKEHFDGDMVEWYESYKQLDDSEEKCISMIAMLMMA
ncbi:uncharacterized protein LOC119613619 isoform X2 [Lucilia sericata]|uniref:uncharacterized protein LOC119613619 isoform X2 n=1 Tax=Lucilia sericata TaxID=13632 RepID=UPI0018A85FEB|nr:uncharacterized protein LOC119613619 isoform X2 [Lucilia sericata]